MVGLAATTLALGASGQASAFPIDAGHRANDLVGWADYTRGFVDPAVDTFFGAEPTAPNRFFVAADVAYDADNERLFVADIHNHRFLVFDVSSGFSPDQGATFVLGQPDMLTGGADPNDPFGNVNTPNPAYGCAEGVNACGMHRAWAVAYDGNNQHLYGADPDNNRILVWDLSASITDGMPATWVLGQKSFTTSTINLSCDGASSGAVNPCGMSRPNDVLVDTAGQRLFVSDGGNNRILVFDLSAGLQNGMAATAVLGQPTLADRRPGTGCGGIGTGVIDACSLSLPTSMAFDDVGQRLFVSDYDSHRVVVYDLGAGVTNGMPALAALGQPDLVTGTANTACTGGASGDENVNECGFGIYGTMVAYAGRDDRLFVADVANHRVLAFDVASIESGEPAIGVLGQADFTSGYVADAFDWGGGTSRELLNMPQGISYDELGDRLFVTDGGNHRLLTFGANVGGEPLVVDGDVSSSSTTEEPDGSTTVDIVDDEGDGYSVTFPPGTEPLDGQEEIVVTVTDLGNGRGLVRVDAKLPPGETKSITMPTGGTPYICVYDHADGAYVGAFQCSSSDGDWVRLPEDRQCTTAVVRGDLGDNPDDPDDPLGLHEISACVTRRGQTVTIDGLRHTLIGTGEEMPADEVAAPIEIGAGADDEAAPGGCSSAGSTGAGWAAALLALWAALGWRRVTARARRPGRSARR